MLTISDKHQRMLYPEVRITSKSARGSGTIIYSREIPGSPGRFETYVLTNEHVVDSLITVEKKWDSLLKRERKMDVLGTPTVETFEYDFDSRVIGGTNYQADIMAYDKDEDLALLRIRTGKQFDNVVTLYPKGEENQLLCFMPVVNVGCGMGAKPVITFGYLTGFGYEIDNKEFVMITAASIFGNSGGATFLEETGEFIGIPSRITVAQLGWSADIITHLGFSIPIWRIYQFLDDQIFHFVYDDNVTSAECEKMREEKRRQSDRELLRGDDEESPGDRNINPKGRQY